MTIDTTLIDSYLDGSLTTMKSHWIFSAIEKNEHHFEEVSINDKTELYEAYSIALTSLNHFNPFNENLFTYLFPTWKQLYKSCHIVLSIGVPEPYDAMVRTHQNIEYMIFDIRLLLKSSHGDLKQLGYILRKLITHELAHLCVHQIYPEVITPYEVALAYNCFDEGFAHYLAFDECNESIDFCTIYSLYYNDAFNLLKKALNETNIANQTIFLEQANTGAYWDKFAATVGQLYIAMNRRDIKNILDAGYKVFIEKVLIDT